MTTTPTAAARPARAQVAEEAIVPVRTRRSWVWTTGAAALILVGGLVNVFLFTSVGHPHDVFAVSHELPRGTTITASDLTSLALVSGQSTPAISASSSSDVIGKVTTVDLPKGSLITPASIAATQEIPDGRALVGLSLKASQLPGEPLVAGNHIEIVPIATDATDATDAVSVTTSSIPGVVSDTTVDQQSDTTIVDVYVSQTVAADLTSRAAAGTVAIYLTSTND